MALVTQMKRHAVVKIGGVDHQLTRSSRPLEIQGIPGEAPVLRWAGSKKKLVPDLQLASPIKYARYIEPFVGSGVLFLALCPSKAILADINPHLIQAYRLIASDPYDVWSFLKKMPASEEFYYELRTVNWEGLNELERAARFVYLNRYCFNGVYRTNLKGQFNVARGSGNLGIPAWEVFSTFSDRLKNASIFHSDFEMIIDKAKKDDFIYLDPPYLEEGKRDRGEYGFGNFSEDDLGRLVETVKRADRRGAKVLFSYTAASSIHEEFDGWQVKKIGVQRSVSRDILNRKQAKEILISNY